MKKLFAALSLTILFTFYGTRSWSQANTELSNLVSPTKVNVSLLPTTDNSKNLGSSSKSWKDFYLGGDLYIDDTRFLSIAGSLGGNTFVGPQAGLSTTSGFNNSAFGNYAFYENTTGDNNSAFGKSALFNNTTGNNNSAFGLEAGYHTTSGSSNSFFGFTAGLSNTTGTDNCFFGADAGKTSSAASYNSFFGQAAGLANIGSYNSFFGEAAGYSNTTGAENSFFGEDAGQSNTTGSENSFFGEDAGYFNTTGTENAFFGADAAQSNTSGSQNSFFGRSAGISNTTATYNSYFGFQAASEATGGDNTVIGGSSGFHLTSGTENTFVGQNAGYLLTTGSNVTCVGDFARVGVSTVSNASAFGSDAIVSSSNSVRIGSTSVASIGGYAGWSNFSDGAYKKNVQEDVPGLEFISKLRPVTYTLDIAGINKFYGYEGDQGNAFTLQSINEKGKIIYTGFIAQEVEAAAREVGYDFSGVDVPKNENDLYGLRYAEFVVPLVKAVQELSIINETKDDQIRDLQSENESLIFRLERIEQQMGIIAIDGKKVADQRGASLEQNIPNPAKNTTTIRFYIPLTVTNAQLIITDASGKIIQQFNHLMVGQSQVEISTPILSSGTYQYSLYADGKKVDTKQMIISQ